MKREQIQYIKDVLVRKMDDLQGASNKMVEEMKKERMELADPLTGRPSNWTGSSR